MTVFELKDLREWHELLETSDKSPVLLFKFSPICPVSHYAESEFLSYLKECPEQLKVFSVNVIAHRNISKQAAADLEVTHQSPQILLIYKRKCLWYDSHSSLTVEALRSNIKLSI